MENKHSYTSRFSHLAASAALSIVAVVGVIGWQIYRIVQEKNTNLQAIAAAGTANTGVGNANTGLGIAPAATSSSPEEISQLGTNAIGQLVVDYAALTQTTPYTSELGAQIAASVAPTLQVRVAHTTYDAKTLSTDPDTSYKRMLAYRTALQASLKPMMKNEKGELDMYNTYIQTHDASYLTQLKTAAQNYRDAAVGTAKVVVPADAVSYQIGILNAMQEFAATLDVMADNADDPLTSVALLGSYNQAEANMTNSFAALNTYYTQKQP